MPLLDINEAAEMVGVLPSTITGWLRYYKVPKKKVGNKNYFEKSDLEKALHLADTKRTTLIHMPRKQFHQTVEPEGIAKRKRTKIFLFDTLGNMVGKTYYDTKEQRYLIDIFENIDTAIGVQRIAQHKAVIVYQSPTEEYARIIEDKEIRPLLENLGFESDRIMRVVFGREKVAEGE